MNRWTEIVQWVKEKGGNRMGRTTTTEQIRSKCYHPSQEVSERRVSQDRSQVKIMKCRSQHRKYYRIPTVYYTDIYFYIRLPYIDYRCLIALFLIVT